MKYTRRSTYLRRMLVAASVAVGGLVVVPLAAAHKPVFEPLPAQEFTDTTSCVFDVSVTLSEGQTAKTFSSGKVIITGPLTGTFSANGTTLTLNVSGPVTINADGMSAVGRGVGAGPVLLPDGSVKLVQAAGPVSIGPDGAKLEHGTVLTDICAALAG